MTTKLVCATRVGKKKLAREEVGKEEASLGNNFELSIIRQPAGDCEEKGNARRSSSGLELDNIKATTEERQSLVPELARCLIRVC